MDTNAMVPSLGLMTLVAVALLAIVGYLLFLRKRSNRHPTERLEQAGHTMAPVEGDKP